MTLLTPRPEYVMRCRCGWEELFDIDSDEAAWSLAYLTGWTPLGNTDLCPRCWANRGERNDAVRGLLQASLRRGNGLRCEHVSLSAANRDQQ